MIREPSIAASSNRRTAKPSRKRNVTCMYIGILQLVRLTVQLYDTARLIQLYL